MKVALILMLMVIIGLISSYAGCIEKPPKTGIPMDKHPVFKAWEVYTIGSLDVVSKQEIKDITGILKTKNGQGIKLHQKQVPTDVREEESIYAAFKCNDLEGYYIFVISPGCTRGPALGVIEIDNIEIRDNKTSNYKFLDVIYRANMPFNINIFYSRDPSIRNVWLMNVRAYETQIFYAFPIDMAMIGLDTNIDPGIMGRFRWRTASFELQPNLIEEAKKVDLAQVFLEELDSILRYENNATKSAMFHWDEKKVNETSINQVISKFETNEYHPTIRIWYGSEYIETGAKPPVIIQKIVVFDDNEDIAGTIVVGV